MQPCISKSRLVLSISSKFETLKMNSLTVVFSILFSCVLFNMGSCAVRLSIAPDKLIATIEESVDISCTVDKEDVNDGEVTVIELYRNDEAPIAVLRHCSDISYGPQAPIRFQAAGTINKETGHSFLNLTLTKPTSGDTGIYTCVVYFLDQHGSMKDQKASQNMVVENLDVSALETVLNTMKDKIAVLEGKQAETNKLVTGLDVKTTKQIKDLSQTDSAIMNNLTALRQDTSQQLNSLTDKVNYTEAFSATKINTHIYPNPGSVLVLPDVIMRIGQGYNETTGVFTAPRDGIYVFHVVVTDGSTRCGIELDLKVNNAVVATMYGRDNNNWEQSSISSVANLKVGDKVYSFVRASGCTFRDNNQTVFTGYIIQAL